MAANDPNFCAYDAPQFFDFNNEDLQNDDADLWFDVDRESVRQPMEIPLTTATAETEADCRPSKHLSMKRSVTRPKRDSDNSYNNSEITSPPAKKRRASLSNLKLRLSYATKRQFSVRRNSLRARLLARRNKTIRKSVKELDFVSTLRRYETPPENAGKSTVTVPVPFKLSATGNKHPVEAFKSVAEQVIAFQTKTPVRFRSKPSATSTDPQKSHNVAVAKPCVPKSPLLSTSSRQRPVAALSYAQMEEKEVNEMKNFQFRATKIDEAIFKHPTGIPHVDPKPPTVAEPFVLHTGTRFTHKEITTEEQPVVFRARPIPKGLFRKSTRLLETNENPALQLLPSEAQVSAVVNETESAVEENRNPALQSTVTSVPESGPSSSSVKWDPKPTQVQPFSFSKQDKIRFLERQKKIQKLFDEERKRREFHANPLPKFCVSGVPEKHSKPATQPQPFTMHIDERGEKTAKKWVAEMKEELKRQRMAAEFKARPCTVLQRDPFVPQPVVHPLTECGNWTLYTEQRANERKEFDEKMRLKEMKKEEILEERRKAIEEEEKQAIAKLRAELVHRAQPVSKYKGVSKPTKCSSPTRPLSPKLRTNARRRGRLPCNANGVSENEAVGE